MDHLPDVVEDLEELLHRESSFPAVQCSDELVALVGILHE